jgi:hypothetical protein
MEADFKRWIDENYSVRFGNYVIGDEELSETQIVPT